MSPRNFLNGVARHLDMENSALTVAVGYGFMGRILMPMGPFQ